MAAKIIFNLGRAAQETFSEEMLKFLFSTNLSTEEHITKLQKINICRNIIEDGARGILIVLEIVVDL